MGSGDLTYRPITNIAGFPAGLQGNNGYANAAGLIIGGTNAAEGHLQTAYRALFAKRALGAIGANQEATRRLGADSGALGLSGGLSRRIGLERDSQTIGAIGDASAESTYGLETDLAELEKGTGSELAGLKLNELGTNLSAYVAKQGIKAGNKQALIGLGGDVLSAGVKAGMAA